MGISKDSKEDDLKRQTIGVGETITISLEAKPALMGDPKNWNGSSRMKKVY